MMLDSVLKNFDYSKPRRVLAQGIAHGSGGDHLDGLVVPVLVASVVASVPVTGEHRRHIMGLELFQ